MQADLTTAPVHWRDGVVLVCNRCGERLLADAPRDPAAADTPAPPNPASALRDELKARLKDAGLWGPVRVVSTSCLGVCPRGGITVAPLIGGPTLSAIVVNSATQVDDLYHVLAAAARGAGAARNVPQPEGDL